MSCGKLAPEFLQEIFPAEKTDEFFDALYGEAEEGAYDISLACQDVSPNQANLLFRLRQRPGQCLKCSLTYGLPQVFARHPVINAGKIAKDVAARLGWTGEPTFRFGITQEVDDTLHQIPFSVIKG